MKVYFFFLLFFAINPLISSPQCVEYNGTRWLRQGPMEHVDCDCNCNRSYRTDIFDKKGRRCFQCGHKLIQTDPVIHEKIAARLEHHIAQLQHQ